MDPTNTPNQSAGPRAARMAVVVLAAGVAAWLIWSAQSAANPTEAHGSEPEAAVDIAPEPAPLSEETPEVETPPVVDVTAPPMAYQEAVFLSTSKSLSPETLQQVREDSGRFLSSSKNPNVVLPPPDPTATKENSEPGASGADGR